MLLSISFTEPLLLILRIIILALLVTGCAALPRPQPPEVPAPPPEVRVEPQLRKVFADFAAVIAQPGDTLASLAREYLRDPSMDWFIAEFNGITTVSPGQPLIIPFSPFAKGGLTLKGYQTVPVISYHRFSKDKTDLTTVTEKAFEEQMRFLKEHGYRIITMDELFDFLDFKKQIPKKSVVITIDDGWRSAYDIAFPILKKYGYPATLFVYTDFIFQSSKTTLDWDLLREMAKNGISVQCHTKTHRYLDRRVGHESFKEYFEAVKKDLVESTRLIKQRLNSDVKYLAYPYGETNHLVIALLMKLGYRGAFTVERGSSPFFTPPYRINRSMIYGTFDLRDFENNLNTLSNKALR
jgi:peptidoglycan/xylan/chitin deacetylase (PgdA/CDA1 family)